VPWFERRNFWTRYVEYVPSSLATVTKSAESSCTTPALSATITSPAVDRGAVLHPGAHERRLAAQQRHGLALHVGPHERAVGVVVLEERDHRRRDRHHLRGETSM
jgi:hypothetical protein